MQHSRDVPFRLLTRGHNQEMMPSSPAAVECAAPRQVRAAAVALPEPGPDEVFVTTYFSGISGGTELLAYRGEIDPGCRSTIASSRSTGRSPTRSDTVFAFHHTTVVVDPCELSPLRRGGGVPLDEQQHLLPTQQCRHQL